MSKHRIENVLEVIEIHKIYLSKYDDIIIEAKVLDIDKNPREIKIFVPPEDYLVRKIFADIEKIEIEWERQEKEGIEVSTVWGD